MKLNSIGNHYRRLLFPIVFFVIAAILLVAGIFVTLNAKKGYAETTATITNIEHEQLGDSDYYHVFVDYTVGGHAYTNVEINSYDSSYQVGKQITILYNPNNPSEIVGKNPSWLNIVLFVASGVLFVAFALCIVFAIRRGKLTKATKENPTIEERPIGEPQKLYFGLDTHTHVKLRFYIEDENRNLLYEGKMTKYSPLAPYTYVFTDHVNHTETEHKVGHVSNAGTESLTLSQGFTFDGVEMTEYLAANHISMRYGVGSGVSYAVDVYHNDKLIANARSSSPYLHEDEQEAHSIASKFRLNNFFFQIEGQPNYVDVIFLALFKEAQSPRPASLL